MKSQLFENKINLLRDELFDENQQERQFVKTQICEVVMTAKHEAAVCHPELVELWKAQEHLMKACRTMAAYISSVANRVLGSEMNDRCVLADSFFCKKYPFGDVFSINLGDKPVGGHMLNQLISEIGKPYAYDYWLTSKVNQEGKTVIYLEFSGTSTDHLQPFYVYRNWNLGDDNNQPVLINEERRSKLEESLSTIPEGISVVDVHLPVMLGDTPCIEATVNGEHRSDMLSQFDYFEYNTIKESEEKELPRMVDYLVCKYLLKESCSWVTDGIPLCYVNRDDESKICVREYFSLPASERIKYLLYDRRWDGDFSQDKFVKDGRLNLVRWLESIGQDSSLSFYLCSKRGSSCSISEVLEKWEKRKKKKPKDGRK